MNYPVIIRAESAQQYVAQTLGIPEVKVVAATEAEAIAQVTEALGHWLATAKVIHVTVSGKEPGNPWLDALTTEGMQAPPAEGFGSVGTFLRRTTYHYWYHLGEALEVRQMLGHGNLPDFVGDIDSYAPYRPE